MQKELRTKKSVFLAFEREKQTFPSTIPSGRLETVVFSTFSSSCIQRDTAESKENYSWSSGEKSKARRTKRLLFSLKGKNTDFLVLSSFCIFSGDFFTHSGQFGPRKKENQH